MTWNELSVSKRLVIRSAPAIRLDPLLRLFDAAANNNDDLEDVEIDEETRLNWTDTATEYRS